jgi:uracil-DNA glycosylase
MEEKMVTTQLDVEQRARELLKDLAADPHLGRFVDSALGIPEIYKGSGEIRLIILGQDPTVKNIHSRAAIRTVLNLDKGGSLRNYLSRVCNNLGLDLDRNVYATNYLKNFFIKPPTQIKEIDVFQEFASIWLPLLHDELSMFPQVAVITLGQPLLSALVNEGASPHVRDYWGYVPGWTSGEAGPLQCLEPGENRLERVVFPFPHQPSIRKRFYKERFEDYTAFAGRRMRSSR